jgi:aspartate-semialdehyde dehydrogenase
MGAWQPVAVRDPWIIRAKEVSVSKSVAVCGATGAVGQEMLRVLEKRDFPLSRLKLLASERSRGKKLTFRGEEIPVEVLSTASFTGVDIALLSAGAKTSRAYREALGASGTLAIDNSSAFRMEPDVPLVVPEVNAEDVQTHNGIIANPNCSTIVMNVPVWPLHQEIGVERIQVATYQAASGAGARAMYELIEETRKYLDGEAYERTVIPPSTSSRTTPPSWRTTTARRSGRWCVKPGRSSMSPSSA